MIVIFQSELSSVYFLLPCMTNSIVQTDPLFVDVVVE